MFKLKDKDRTNEQSPSIKWRTNEKDYKRTNEIRERERKEKDF